MSEAESLRAFVTEVLTDAGAEVSDHGGILWVHSPESLHQALDIPETLALAFESGRVGEFGAELIASGSYLLERILHLAMRRGRWDLGRVHPVGRKWIQEVLSESGFGVATEVAIGTTREDVYLVFTFRVVLMSDEKRETFHAIVVPLGSDIGWEVPTDIAECTLSEVSLPVLPSDLGSAYASAARALQAASGESVERFRKTALAALEEEVRRIFAYFDGTVREMRAASPPGSEEVVRAIEAERSRRLTEALERFEPYAQASLCGVRVIVSPTASLRVRIDGKGSREVNVVVDVFTRSVRGPVCDRCGCPTGPRTRGPAGEVLCRACAATAAAFAPLPARPQSGIPRPQRRAGSASERSSRGSRARSRSASSAYRDP